MRRVRLFDRLSALKSLLQNLLQAEDIVKVNEARLTEKETSSLDLKEVASYQSTLKVCHTSIQCYNEWDLFLRTCLDLMTQFVVLANEK